MKLKIVPIVLCLGLTVMFYACNGGCDGDVYLDDKPQTDTQLFDSSLTYVVCSIGENLWADTTFGTCYAKIPSSEAPAWFDVVLASDDINSAETKLIRRYFYLHVNLNTVVKGFSFEDTMTFESGYRIIYYENKTTDTDHAEFSLYMTSPQGSVVITENDSNLISGYFEGTLINAANVTDKRNARIEFNKIPLSLAK